MARLFDRKTEERDYEDDGFIFTETLVYIYSYEDEYGVISGEWHKNPSLITGASFIPTRDYFAPISPEERVEMQRSLGNRPEWLLISRY